MCGLASTLSNCSNGWSGGGGSLSQTSRPAPAIRLSRSASYERLLVVNEAARRGDEERVRLHQRELARADHAAIVLGQGTGDRDEIRTPHQLVELDLLAAPRGDLLRRQIGVVGDHLHVQEAVAQFGDAAADIADADDADGLALRLVARSAHCD